MRFTFFLSVALATVVCLSGCKNRTSKSSQAADSAADENQELLVGDSGLTGEDLQFHDGNLTPLERVLMEEVDSLTSQKWNKNEYHRLKNLIETLEGLSFNSRESFTSLLDGNYCISMDNEARQIMTSPSCEKSHAHLKDIMAERGTFSAGKTTQGKAIQASYSHHQEMMNLISSFSQRQIVDKYLDKYDIAFEKKMKDEAAAQFNKYKPACDYLSRNLKNPGFSRRRLHYCESILGLYLQESSFDQGECNKVIGLLKDCYGDTHPEKMAEWKNRLDVFRDQLTAPSN